MADYKIYALIDPRTSEVRYIGYTMKPLENRLRYHYHDVNKGVKSHKTSWLKSLTKLSITAEIKCIEQGIETVDQVCAREIYWITQHTNLVNSTSGGEKNKVYSADVKNKMSENRKGKAAGKDNGMFGKVREDLKQRNLTNNPSKNKETNLRIGAILKEKYNTPEYLKIHSESQRNRKGVVRMDLTGNVLESYGSLRLAQRQGYHRKEIIKCCEGIYKQSKGFVWRYAA